MTTIPALKRKRFIYKVSAVGVTYSKEMKTIPCHAKLEKILIVKVKKSCLLAFASLLMPLAGNVFGDSTMANGPVNSSGKTHKMEVNPDQKAYNQAIDDFNQATQAYNSAKNEGKPLDNANGLLTKNITELQTVAQLPSLQKDTATQATIHNLIGYLFLTQNNPASAIPELQNTVQLTPEDLDARNNLGNALKQTGHFDDAAVQYRYVLDHLTTGKTGLDPARIRLNLADALGQGGKTDEALAVLNDAAASNPDVATYRSQGFYLQKSGQNSQAADAYEKAGELNPKDARMWLNAGLLDAKAKRTPEAIAALTKAVGPNVVPPLDSAGQYIAYFTLGEAHAAQGEANEAIKDFDTAATLQPSNDVPLYNKGVMEEQAGLKADAELSYTSALVRDGGSIQIQTALGLLLVNEGKNPEAATVLAAVLKKMPQDVAAAPLYASLGDVYSKQGEIANSIQARQTALALNPNDADTHLALAATYQRQKQYVPALAQYEAAAALRPTDASIQNQRGMIYKSLKQYPKALKAFQKSFAIDPTNAQVLNNIGVLDELLGSKKQALAAYKKALALNPSLAVARHNLNRFAHR
jgi:tetratricopeptide (TPR) repeat protein